MNAEQQHPDMELPFYVNGTLDSQLSSEIESHLAVCEKCRQEVQFLRTLAVEVKQQGNVNHAEMEWKRLQKKIRAEKKTEAGPAVLWRAVASLALLALVIQSIFLYRPGTITEGYRPLGDAQYSVQVQFYPGVTEQQIRDILIDVDARIIDGPGVLGIYHLQANSRQQEPDDAAQQRVRKKLLLYREQIKYVSE